MVGFHRHLSPSSIGSLSDVLRDDKNNYCVLAKCMNKLSFSVSGTNFQYGIKFRTVAAVYEVVKD